MKLTLTVEELFDLYLWEEWCKLSGVSEYAVAEGQMSYREEVTLSENDMHRLGIGVARRGQVVK